MQDSEVIAEFVIESSENLARLDREMVELEQTPADAGLLASIFRTIHTIKGTCGFLGFSTLEGVTHYAENILSQLRDGKNTLTPQLVSLILETVDAVKAEITSIETRGGESGARYDDLRKRLQEAAERAPARVEELAISPSISEVVKPPAPASVTYSLVDVSLADKKETAEAVDLEDPEPDILPDVICDALQSKAIDPDATKPGKTVSASDSTIRVDVGLLDKLMNLVGELVLARNQILQFNARQEDAGLNATSQRLNLITTELQESVMKTRMQPIGVVWNKLPRVVRDLASSCGKMIHLEMDGAGTELDKTIIEAIKDPLTHIVRNACDHGIELPDVRARQSKPAQGRLTLRAFHAGGNVNIEIADDGAGIDAQRVRSKALQLGLLRPEQAGRMHERELLSLVFQPGFSTAQKVTSISGRGVGMDVVKTNIEKIGGTVDLISRQGQGTTVKIKIPLTLAIIPGLVVTCGGERFVIPQVNLTELVRLEGADIRKQIEWIQQAPVYRRRGNLLPLAYLNKVLEVKREGGSAGDSAVVNIVVLQAEDSQFGLVVDGINDTQEIVVKPLGKLLKGVSCYAGATIMGDGKVALILDVMGIAQRAGVLGESRRSGRSEEAPAADASRTERQSLLLFRSGSFERLAVPLSLVARLEEIPRAKIEQAAGRLVVQYRGQILPLVPLSEQLGSAGSTADAGCDPAQVIVFSDGQRRIGLLVDQILDIVEESTTVRKPSTRPGLLGSAVIGQRVTDFLDLHSVIQGADENWFQQQSLRCEGAIVLVAETSGFTRSLLRNNLEMAGHHVIEAATAQEALDKIARERVDVVVTSLDLPGRSAFELLESIRSQPALTRIPVLALTTRPEDASPRGANGSAFAEYLMKFDRAAMLESVDRLASALHAAESVTAVAQFGGKEN